MKSSFTAMIQKNAIAIIVIIQLFFTTLSFATNTSIHKGDVDDELITLKIETGEVTPENSAPNGYALIWSDEFDTDGAVNSEKWYHQTQLIAGSAWANGELQHYTNRTDNSFVENGALMIVAKRESFTDQGFTKEYTSARLNSKVAFTYGRVDVRAKLPQGDGTWPAIWTLGTNINETGGYWNDNVDQVNWPACGEIDIMEHWGNAPNVIHGSLHTPSSFGATVNTGTIDGDNVSNTFHVYSMIWDENQIQFLMDEVPFYTYNPTEKNASTWPFDKPQYLLLNIAMGGIGGAIDPNFSQTSMEIDYVRIYQMDDGSSTVDQPLVAAPIPTDNSDNVRAIFSDTYPNISDVDYNPIGGQSTITSQVDIAGNNTLKYEDLNFQAIDFSSNSQDLSGVNSLHIDYWTYNATELNVKLISSGPNESPYALPITIGEWESIDIPLTAFPNTVDLTAIIQLEFDGNGTVFLDNIYFLSATSTEVFTEPDIAAPLPIIGEEKVISIFSDTYSDITGVNYNLDLGQTTVTSLVNIEGNFALKYEDLNYQVTDFTSNRQDITEMTTLHIDYWASNVTSLDAFLVSSGPNEDPYSIAIKNDQWISLDIPLTEFSSPVDFMDIIQLKFEGDGTIYLDNIYFYNEVSVESQAITFEAITDKTLGDDPFILNATANSGLEVVFSSTSNRITLKDGEVTLLSAGRVTINADQEGNANFETAPTVSQDFCINPRKGEITVSDENSTLVTLTSSSNIGNQWFLNGDPITNAIGPSIKAEAEGNYNVQITIDGCMGEISDDFSLVVTGTNLASAFDVSVSPNPAVDFIQIMDFAGDVRHIDLLDLSGKSQQVIFEKTQNATIKANIRNLPAGLYLLALKGSQGKELIRIIKN